jgi:hypothetical protein
MGGARANDAEYREDARKEMRFFEGRKLTRASSFEQQLTKRARAPRIPPKSSE